MEPEVGCDKANPVLGDGRPDGEAGAVHRRQPSRPASAGGALRAGIGHQAVLHQLGQVLVDGGQAEAKITRQRLLGADAGRAVDVMVYAVMGFPAALVGGGFRRHGVPSCSKFSFYT